MKVIFLDIDGVLVNKKFEDGLRWREFPHRFKLFSQEALLNLKDIEYATGASLVLSSSWRYAEDETHAVERQLAPYNLKLYSMTPFESECKEKTKDWRRGSQIKIWLNNHPDVTEYVILDDDDDMLPEQMSHLVQTTWERGLEFEHINQAIGILNGEHD